MEIGGLLSARGKRGRRCGERGQAMLILLVVIVVAIALAITVLRFVDFRQQMAGQHYRTLVARYLAEAGVERVLWALDAGFGNLQPLVGSSEQLTWGSIQGRFSLEEIREGPGDSYVIVSGGEFGGTHDRVKVTVRLVPHVLTYALFGDQLIQLEGAASRLYLLPVSMSSGCPGGSSLGSNAEIWFMNPGAAVNSFTGAALGLREGSQPDYALLGMETQSAQGQGDRCLGKATLGGAGAVTFGGAHQAVFSSRWLQGQGVEFNADIRSTPMPEALPLIDRATLQALAAANGANATINKAVGSRSWPPLLNKGDSVYTREEFQHILAYLSGTPSATLQGPIYVVGPIVVPGEASIRLTDGFLAVEGSLTVQIGGRLEVLHTARSSNFPGIMTIGEAAPLVVQQRGVLVVDGLVNAQRIFDAEQGALIDIRGAVLAGDPHVSIHIHDATVVVRYNPLVFNTLGILPGPGGRTEARVVAWEEVR